MRTKRWMSFLLCLLMCVGLFPMAVLADGDRYLEINETNFPDAIFRQWVKDNLAGGKDYMTQAEVLETESIEANQMGIASVKGIECFPALQRLVCDKNKLTEIDVSQNTALRHLSCSENQLTSLDVSSCRDLENLYCYDNQLTVLDASNNTKLAWLLCYNNQLTSLNVSTCERLLVLRCSNNQLPMLNVSNNYILKEFDCSYNQLTTLDISHAYYSIEELRCSNNKLTTLVLADEWHHNLCDLSCSYNQLTSLDVSKCKKLTGLWCEDNQLTALDVSNNQELERLSCSNNQLTALDLSENPELKHLFCGSNKIKALDVSDKTALERFSCSDNSLTVLDVSKNTALKSLWCGHNQLTALDVSKNTALEDLGCEENKLTALDVSHNTALRFLDCSKNRLPMLDLSANEAYEGGNLWQEQEIEGQMLIEAHGGYQFDLSALIPLGNMANVTEARGYIRNAEGNVTCWYDAALDVNTGMVTFTRTVNELWYQYATGRGNMEVSVYFINGPDPIDPPTITTQPKDITVKNGEQATFTVKATSDGIVEEMEYHWYSRPSAEEKWSHMAGGTDNDTYTITGTKDNNGWQFRCGVYNEGGVTYSNTVTLTVTEVATPTPTPTPVPTATPTPVPTATPAPQAPTIKTQPKSANVKSGSKAKFTVKVKEKNVTYQWFVRASAKDEWKEMKGETQNKLTVVGTKANNGTQYRCRVRNAAGGETYTIPVTLTVKTQKPMIKTQPKSLNVKSGKKVKFTVKASGKNITYQWFSRADAKSAWKPVAGGNKNTLNVVASKANNGSQYYCYLKNADGDATSVTVTLTVTPEAPTIKTQPKDAKVKIGGKAKFKVKAKGKNVTYQWYYRTSETGEWILMKGETSANLTVVATADKIGWQFRCLAKNADGQVYSKPATLRQK